MFASYYICPFFLLIWANLQRKLKKSFLWGICQCRFFDPLLLFSIWTLWSIMFFKGKMIFWILTNLKESHVDMTLFVFHCGQSLVLIWWNFMWTGSCLDFIKSHVDMMLFVFHRISWRQGLVFILSNFTWTGSCLSLMKLHVDNVLSLFYRLTCEHDIVYLHRIIM